MKPKFSAKNLALAAVGSAISLVGIALAYFIDAMSISFYALSALGMLLPLSQKCYKEAILSLVAVSLLGMIYANIYVLPYTMVAGGYTIAAIFFYEKKIKPYIVFPIIIVYSCFVFLVVYQLTTLLFIDFEKISFLNNVKKEWLYVILNLIFTACAIVYHFAIISVHKYLAPIIKKIV